MALLEVSNLGIAFGGLQAVAQLDLSFEKGHLYGLIGPNGAGKTTVFNMLTGVYKPTEGDIILDGKDITGQNRELISKSGIARTFQNIRLFKKMTSRTITEYLKEYRVNQSLSLVQSGQYSITQIADMTGFSNASRFAHAFRAQFGCNPSEYNSLKQQKSLPIARTL